MDTREKILSATAELISEHGLQSTPMSLIAERAGVGAGTIYRYFETKEELVVAVYGSLGNEISEAAVASDTAAAPVKVRFLTFWGNLFHYFLDHPKQGTLFDYLSTSPYVNADLKERVFTSVLSVQSEIFTAAKEQQLMKNVPIDICSYFLYGALARLAKNATAHNLVLTDTEIQQVLQMCWDSVRQ